MAYTAAEINSIFDLLLLPRPDAARLERLQNDPRSITEIRDALIWSQANAQGISFDAALQGIVQQQFETLGLNIATAEETAAERLARITQEIVSGQRTLGEVVGTLQSFVTAPTTPAPVTSPLLPPPPVPTIPTPEPVPPPTPVDYRAQAAALYPYLPPALLDLYADFWDDSGDPTLALAELRADPQYTTFFPGIKRADGSLRMSEAEYLSTLDGYRLALGQFGLNPSLFENRFVEMIEGELTVSEFADRLTAAYEGIISQAPELMAYYAENYGISLTPEAVFASFIDPELGDSILNQRIAVSQIGGAAAIQNFDLDLEFAEQLRQSGLSFAKAQEHFAQAAFLLPTLDVLAGRFDLDTDFDITEFSLAGVIGDPQQLKRINRLRAASTSEFTEQLGSLRTTEDFLVQGLTPR